MSVVQNPRPADADASLNLRLNGRRSRRPDCTRAESVVWPAAEKQRRDVVDERHGFIRGRRDLDC